MSNRTAGADYQALGSEFRPGMVVVPHGASRDYAGRVVSVWPAIGMVDVEFPAGTKRYPVEELMRLDGHGNSNPPEDGYVPGGAGTVSVPGGPVTRMAASSEDDEERQWTRIDVDRMVQALFQAARRSYAPHSMEQKEAFKVVQLLENIRKQGVFDVPRNSDVGPIGQGYGISFPETLQTVTARWADMARSSRDRNVKRGLKVLQNFVKQLASVRAASATQKVALYWAQKDRRYRATSDECSSGKYTCPKCKKAQLRKAVYRRIKGKSEHVLGCPTCLFLIAREALIHPETL